MRPTKKVVLSKRDLGVLQFIFEQRAVAFKQIEKRFFSDVSSQAAHRRLEQLSRENLLSKFYTKWDNGRIVVYGITEKGINAFAKSYPYEVTGKSFKSDSINHDLGLVRVRERLEKTKSVVKYFSESMLQNCPVLANDDRLRAFSIANSDAALAIEAKCKKFQVALEYEASRKDLSRYSKKLTEYYFSKSVALVLYVCESREIENLIWLADKEVCQNQSVKVFTCREETFHSSTEFLSFCSRDNATLKLE